MPFQAILRSVIDQHPEVIGVIFCDEQGEMVDMVFGQREHLDPFELRVIGATASTWVLNAARVSTCDTQAVTILIKARKYVFLVEGLKEGYFLMAVAQKTPLHTGIAKTLHKAAVVTSWEM